METKEATRMLHAARLFLSRKQEALSLEEQVEAVSLSNQLECCALLMRGMPAERLATLEGQRLVIGIAATRQALQALAAGNAQKAYELAQYVGRSATTSCVMELGQIALALTIELGDFW